MLESARTTYAISAERFAGSTLRSAFAGKRPSAGKTGPVHSKSAPSGYLREAEYDAGSARRLRIRGFAGVRPRRDVRPRQCAIAAAADADVRSHQRNLRNRWGIRQGRG